MTAINSAIEIDLTGQVCADSIGHRMYSGVGGQMDFMRGAALAEEGRAIIALPSTAADGKFSRITPRLKEGAGVTTTRSHVRYGRHGVRRRRTVRPELPGARQTPDRDRSPGLPRRAHLVRPEVPRAVAADRGPIGSVAPGRTARACCRAAAGHPAPCKKDERRASPPAFVTSRSLGEAPPVAQCRMALRRGNVVPAQTYGPGR